MSELLALVDLEGARDRRIGGYSKGMLQRIGLAQALIQEPRLVILDEPTAGVDPVGSRQIRDLILKLRERGITVFLCSHLLEQVQEVCDHVGIIFQGRMIQRGTSRGADRHRGPDRNRAARRQPGVDGADHRAGGEARRARPWCAPANPAPRWNACSCAKSAKKNDEHPPSIPRSRGSHCSRILIIATHAFTQLARMKVFYFLAIFAVIAIASNFFDLPQHEGPESVGANVLSSIKSWSLGAMTLFSVVLSVVATALLLPKDVEDRTLYTILAKPVPRLDYLAGKLLGVLLLVFVSLALMDVLMTVVLQIRTAMVVAQQEAMATALGWHAGRDRLAARRKPWPTGRIWSLQGAVFAVFLRASIMASLALLISTFSTSTLFTTIVSFLIYFIGHFQADARDFYLQAGQAGEGGLARAVSLLVSLVLPDFQLFNVIDAVIEGQAMPLLVLGKLTLVGGYYALFFTIASWFIFADKEF